jgi:hypothetical protein
MKSHLQPRTLLVLWHAQPLYASLFTDRYLARCSGPRDAYCYNAVPYECPFVFERIGCRRVLATT